MSVFELPADEAERLAVLARVRSMCVLMDGEDGCWIWRRCAEGEAVVKPQMRFRGKVVAVRRVVYFLAHGFEPPEGMWACGCKAYGCVSPACVHAMPRKVVTRRAGRAGAYSKEQALRNRKIAARARAIYSDETVELVRTLECSSAEAARITGMSKAHVSNIRSGRVRTPIDTPPPPPRGTRRQAAIRRAAEAAVRRVRAQRIEPLAAVRAEVGVWGGLLA